MARLYGPGPGAPPRLVATQDLAGLPASDVTDRPVGELFGTLSEEETGLIRYLDVEIRNTPKHVLIPLGHARIDTTALSPRVRLRAATYEDLLSIPDYEPGHTDVGDEEYHTHLLESYGRLFYGAQYYAHPAYDHSGLYAGEAPVVGARGKEMEAGGVGAGLASLVRLGGGRGGAAALLGRAVEDAAGAQIGEVVDLMVEGQAGQVRYGVIELADPPRRTAVPVGYLVAEAGRAEVMLRGLLQNDVRLLPPHEEPMTREHENRIHAALEGRLTGERYFHRPDFRRR
jgi:hypothetical protein